MIQRRALFFSIKRVEGIIAIFDMMLNIFDDVKAGNEDNRDLIKLSDGCNDFDREMSSKYSLTFFSLRLTSFSLHFEQCAS